MLVLIVRYIMSSVGGFNDMVFLMLISKNKTRMDKVSSDIHAVNNNICA